MVDKYIISIDQSTQGTKALLVDKSGNVIYKTYLPHKQIINDSGWVSHNLEEIYENTVLVVKNLIEDNGVDKNAIIGVGISNQRETTAIWDKKTGKSFDNAIVWQCSRAENICNREHIKNASDIIRQKTGMVLSPYFPASKIAWFLENLENIKEVAEERICYGTMDSWLVFKLTQGLSYKTDYSNASRTQLFNIFDLKWDREICDLFGINIKNLPEVVDSNSLFGKTTLEGYFENPIPIHSVLGDSHAALYGQGCLNKGMTKATYGTGSSVMMNIGGEPVLSKNGIVTSLAWGINGDVNYVLEGNINYTGAIISWLKDDIHILNSPDESQVLAEKAIKDDTLYLIPAFSGLSAPYWDSDAKASIIGMDRTTTKNELVRASVESIAYQIFDIVYAMEDDSNIDIEELRVDGGPTRNNYLMKFQSDVINTPIKVPELEELSAIGVAYMLGITLNVFDNKIFEKMNRDCYYPNMSEDMRVSKINGWKNAINSVLTK